MAEKQLSAAAVKGAKPQDKEYRLGDGGNLYLLVKPSGLKLWAFCYKDAQRKNRMLTLGSATDHSLANAREWAMELRALRDRGIDPQAKRDEQKKLDDAAQGRTLDALLKGYIATLRHRGKVTWKSVDACLSLHVSAELRQKAAAEITKDALIQPIRKLVTEGKGRQAAKLRSYLRSAFELAITAADDPKALPQTLGFGLSINPVDRIKTLPEFSRTSERSLTREELAAYWQAITSIKRSSMVRDLLQLSLLLGGQRFTQLAQAEINQDLDGQPVVVIHDAKGRRQHPRRHVLPLQGQALKLVESRGSKLFAMTPELAEQFTKQVSSKVSRISKDMQNKGVVQQPFRGGDLRRTVETHLASLGVGSDLRAQLQSHGLGGVQNRHYDRHDYLKEKREMLQLWENYLTNL